MLRLGSAGPISLATAFAAALATALGAGAAPASASVVYNQLIARHSGKCVDVSGVSTATGALVWQWDCLGAGQTNQQFSLVRVGLTNYYELVARHSGKCLDVSGVSTAN